MPALTKKNSMLDGRAGLFRTSKTPTSVEIVCSTRVNGEVCTEVAATCINYLDYQTQKIRKSFTFQFHPELLEDLSTFHKNMPDFKSLKDDDGIRLLSRVMYRMLID